MVAGAGTGFPDHKVEMHFQDGRAIRRKDRSYRQGGGRRRFVSKGETWSDLDLRKLALAAAHG